ncbi:biotin carboxylase N-terminal domain-containing protein [soil metagenome]
MFRRIAIVNRGESAMRLINAVRDLQADGADLVTIALHTTGERDARFVREADEAYLLGPASARPYLDLGVLREALTQTQAEAAWVGWGFVAEDPAFAELCDDLGVVFIGPSADSMRRLGDKIGAKLVAEEVGVPVAAWSGGSVDTLEAALAAAEEIGYPMMLKATAGGGGRGIRKVTNPGELTDAYQRTRDEAMRAFGSGVVFLERVVTGARHVEVQLIADTHGDAWAVGVRDCSIQRRNQKVIEESASPLLSPDQVAELKSSAERLAVAVGYAGAGTVEFLYQPEDRTFAFLEVNTRLQVEHPVTEAVTGIDLVKAQIRVAAGGRLADLTPDGQRPVERGHAVEARLNAEDADRDFAPAPGRVQLLELPSGPGIRVDTGLAEGDTIPADFDSMIAKVVAWGSDRTEALARLRRAMRQTSVVIEQGTTNKSFVLDLLDQSEVTAGEPVWADTAWIDAARSQGRLATVEHADVALLAAALEAHEEQTRAETAHLLSTAHGGRPQVQHAVGEPRNFTLRGRSYAVITRKLGADRYRMQVETGEGSAEATVHLERLDALHSRLTLAGRRYRVLSAIHGRTHLVEVDGVSHRISLDDQGALRAPSPALVVATPVEAGSEVEAGAPLLVLESMKMETVIPAPFAARITSVLVRAGHQVEAGAPMIRLEPLSDAFEATAVSGASLDLPNEPAPTDPGDRVALRLADLTAALTGFDLDAADRRRALTDYLGARAELAESDRITDAVLSGEARLLEMFADFAELSRNHAIDEERHTELRVHSSREHFHTYLRSLDLARAGLPDAFEVRLRRVLAHYGVESLDRTPELEEAVLRIFVAQQRPAAESEIVTALLQRWAEALTPPVESADHLRSLLERLKAATQLRFPVVGDLARSVRFRWFDQPLVDAERASVLTEVRAEVASLVMDPQTPDRAERIAALAAIPEHIVGVLAERLAAGRGGQEPLLEVLVRRHYQEFELENVEPVVVDGRPLVRADYVIDARTTRLVSTAGDIGELSAGSGLLNALASELADIGDNDHAVVDLYLDWPSAPGTVEEVRASLAGVVAELGLTKSARRVTIAVCPGAGRPVDYFTYRSTDAGQVYEDDLVHGVHPMVGRRLNLWRLRGFHLTRIEAPEDVLLFECVARENPADRRLVALAQVRQLAVVHDEAGTVVGLPHAERAVENCLEAVRRARASGGEAGARLDHNHVWVTVWPVVDADIAHLTALQVRITPLTDGAGIAEVRAAGRVMVGEEIVPVSIKFSARPGAGVEARVEDPPTDLLKPLDDYDAKALRARRRGLVYPYELEGLLTGMEGTFTEYDLDAAGALVPVDRPRGQNSAGIIVGLVSTPTRLHPQGVRRVLLCGDPTRSLGSVAEAECARIIAAIDLAAQLQAPVEWFAISAGARISMTSGTENMDWVAAALRRIVDFTQDGGEINVVVAGINVGAQPYWNAEATMLMHTKGILVMTPDSAMVLTGKQSLDFSGGVSAEDNFGIGGYDRVMGPNGQAQYWAQDLPSAFGVLMAHYEHTYVAPGESGPRQAETSDPAERDICAAPHSVAGSEFTTVGQIFSPEHNPDRKKPFDIRTVMGALADQDLPTLERWASMADADTAVVFDAHLGGHPVCLLGIESRPVPRGGFPPTDGPDLYTAGTLFPRSSKKAARAINAASGNRPLVVLANLSGFDGSPDSMRNLQLEYGAEIGRAIVNFDGPIVFCVISRYHGGAFVVFSKKLNPRMTVLALEGSFASVLGGAPAAAVVFSGEVDKRTAADARVSDLERRVAEADSDGEARGRLVVELAQTRAAVRTEKLGQVAAEFDSTHSIHRAVAVGSVDAVISAARLRPEIIAVIEREMSPALTPAATPAVR